MKKIALIMLIAGVMSSAFIAGPAVSMAEVNINIGINAPLPRLVIPAPPAVILIPGTYAYFIPDIDEDIVFYQDYWYRPHRGHWYRASDYNGPWISINSVKVPGILLGLPPDFRYISPEYERIPYGHVKKNWKTWEHERHWDKHHDNHEHEHKFKEKEWHHKSEKWEHKDGGKKGKHKHDD